LEAKPGPERDIGAELIDPGQQFAPAAGAEALMKGLDVVVDRVGAELEAERDLLLAVALQQAVEGLAQARRQGGGGIDSAAEGIGLPGPPQLTVEQAPEAMVSRREGGIDRRAMQPELVNRAGMRQDNLRKDEAAPRVQRLARAEGHLVILARTRFG